MTSLTCETRKEQANGTHVRSGLCYAWPAASYDAARQGNRLHLLGRFVPEVLA
jgi:hypothetical protein